MQPHHSMTGEVRRRPRTQADCGHNKQSRRPGGPVSAVGRPSWRTRDRGRGTAWHGGYSKGGAAGRAPPPGARIGGMVEIRLVYTRR